MESFTTLDQRIFGSDLTAAEKVVWIAIKSFEINGQGCVTPIQGIAKRAGYGFRHAQRVIDRLVVKDYCQKIIHRGGPSSLTVKFPDTHDIQVMTQESRPNGHDPQVTGKPDFSSTKLTPMTSRSRPNGHTKTLRTNTEKRREEQEPPLVDTQGDSPVDKPVDKSKPKIEKKPATHDPEQIEKEIDEQVKVEHWKKQYEWRGINVESRFTIFKNSQISRRNPNNYVDWNRTFHNALEFHLAEIQQARDRQQTIARKQADKIPDKSTWER